MKPALHLDENPCRPRHYKPAPCGALPQDGPEKELIETSRTRLLLTGVLFALYLLFALNEERWLKGGYGRAFLDYMETVPRFLDERTFRRAITDI